MTKPTGIPRKPNPQDWPPKHVERLKALWAEGKTAGEIVKLLQGRYSRNAVLGKKHRLKLADRPHCYGKPLNATLPWKRHAKKAKAPGTNKRPKFGLLFNGPQIKSVKPYEPVAIPLPPTSAPVPLLDAERNQCRFISDQTSGPATMVCGASVEGETSWCAWHARIVFVPPDVRKRTHRRIVGGVAA